MSNRIQKNFFNPYLGTSEMTLKDIVWDYPRPLDDKLWRARRMAEYLPFVLDKLTRKDKEILLEHLDKIDLPEERKEFIRLVCSGK